MIFGLVGCSFAFAFCFLLVFDWPSQFTPSILVGSFWCILFVINIFCLFSS